VGQAGKSDSYDDELARIDASIAELKIRDMAADPKALEQAGARGYQYVMADGHNWEDESAPALIAAYDRLLGCAG
jgi:hypothetical protein